MILPLLDCAALHLGLHILLHGLHKIVWTARLEYARRLKGEKLFSRGCDVSLDISGDCTITMLNCLGFRQLVIHLAFAVFFILCIYILLAPPPPCPQLLGGAIQNFID